MVLGAAVSDGAPTPLGGDESRRASSTGPNLGGGGGSALPSPPGQTIPGRALPEGYRGRGGACAAPCAPRPLGSGPERRRQGTGPFWGGGALATAAAGAAGFGVAAGAAAAPSRGSVAAASCRRSSKHCI